MGTLAALTHYLSCFALLVVCIPLRCQYLTGAHSYSVQISSQTQQIQADGFTQRRYSGIERDDGGIVQSRERARLGAESNG
ncbi:unnamed protein product [Lathyrus oleraceus]